MDTLSTKLKKLRILRQVSQQWLANAIGVTQGAINRIESGGSTTYIIQISHVLKCDPNWLGGERGVSPFYYDEINFLKPLVDNSADLVSFNPNVNIMTPEAHMENSKIPVPFLINKNCFFIQLMDDSMLSHDQSKRQFPRGCYILIDPDKKPDQESFVLAKEKDSERPFFRQYITDGKNKYIIPFNDNGIYQKRSVDDNIALLGTMIFQGLE